MYYLAALHKTKYLFVQNAHTSVQISQMQ